MEAYIKAYMLLPEAVTLPVDGTPGIVDIEGNSAQNHQYPDANQGPAPRGVYLVYPIRGCWDSVIESHQD